MLTFFPLFCFSQVAQVNSYDELVAYTGSADSVYVTHSRYFGMFFKGDCAASDFGTAFKTPNTCWQRIHNNYSPRFWEIGGQSPSKKIGSVVKEVDAINSANYAAWIAGGDTLELNGMYKIDRSIWLLEKNTYLGMTDSSGFIRESPPKTVLTHTTSVNDRKIYVKDNSGFRSLQRINIANNIDYDSLAGFVSYTAFLSNQLGGDTTIFLSGRSIREIMNPGDSVSLFFPMMEGVSWASGDNIRIKNLVFDGNRDEYTLNYDWRVNTTILFPTNIGSEIDHCRFYNIATENIFLCGTNITNSSGVGFNGSAIHFSCSAKGSPTEVLYNEFSDLNEVGNAVMKHSEAALTFSSKVRNFRISYNKLSDIQEVGIGLISNDDTTNIITDNLIETENAEIGYRPFYRYDSTNFVYNNKNPLNTFNATGSCFLADPKPVGTSPCQAGSSFEKPLQLGDLINIPLDSLYMLNSNENFVKGIFINYENDYFDLVGIGLINPLMSTHHSWSFERYKSMEGLVFNNGHKDGIYKEGNWGYELCGKPGGCKNLKAYFKVKKLPEETSAVPCPLEGLSVLYDADMGTWNSPVLCENKQISFSQSLLGQPVLYGNSSCEIPSKLSSNVTSQFTVDINWQTSSNVSQSLVWYKPEGTTKWKKILVKNVGTKQLKRLQNSVKYTWMIQAKCGLVWGSLSEQKTFIIEPDACGEIEYDDVNAHPVSISSARLNWPTRETYRTNIRWRLLGTDNWTLKSTKSDFRFWIKNLSSGSTYEYQLRAVCIDDNALIISPWSELGTFTTDILSNAQSRAPDHPSQVKIETVTERFSTDIKLVPNPARTEIQLYSLNLELKYAQIVDVTGKIFLVHQFSDGGQGSILISDLPEGIYLIKIQSNKGLHIKKLIIEK